MNISTPIIEKTSGNEGDQSDDRIAVVGVAGRFPGAQTITDFWRNLEQNVKVDRAWKKTVNAGVFPSFNSDENLCFDASFFGLSPSEAAMMDPQHRVFLETAWQAMDDAGFSNGTGTDITGVFAAAGFNDYVLKHVGPVSYADSAAEYFAMLIGNDKDFLASRTAYFLDLKGPATIVQSACSSGLLAVHQGMQSLLQGEVDIALTGGASICLDLENGYFADEGGAMSPSGTIAPFSEQSDGIVGGNGTAALVLKRLDDAVDNSDHIYAIIHASAVNNDGADRASFTSPSVQGQKKVLQEALHLSGLNASDITYIEAHGTGTPLGDPIEFDAINHVYGKSDNPCSIGSVKSNIGHLNTVSGLAGLIKAIGVMHRGIVPPMQNFTKSNPLLSIEKSRFHINTEVENIPMENRYAALSSFGFGGTNVHLILGAYQAEYSQEKITDDAPHLLLFSAKTPDALTRMKESLLTVSPSIDMHHYAATLIHGRANFNERCALIAANGELAIKGVTQGDFQERASLPHKAHKDPIFLFAGQGNQYAGMGQWLYQHRQVYRNIVDRCADIVSPLLGEDIRLRIFSDSDNDLLSTRYTQLGLFITEYASACLLMDAGVKPAAMLGHSIGEYVAACIAGVFSLNDALALVNERGRIIEQLPHSSMLLVSLTVEQLIPYIKNEALSLAVVNKVDRCVVSGSVDVIDNFAKKMTEAGIDVYLLTVSHGFHSHLLDPVLAQFSAVCQSIDYSKPVYPLLSNSSGKLATPEALMSADYWVNHLRDTVYFTSNAQYLSEHWQGHLCIDLSPGNSMDYLLSDHPSLKVLPFIGNKQTQGNNFLAAIGALWIAGHTSVEKLVLEERPWQRVSLPAYPFARDIHVLPKLAYGQADEPISVTQELACITNDKAVSSNRKQNILSQQEHVAACYRPCWHPVSAHKSSEQLDAALYNIYFVNNKYDIETTENTIIVRSGVNFNVLSDGTIIVNPTKKENFELLLQHLESLGISDIQGHQANCYYAWLMDDNDAEFTVKQIAYDSFCRLAQTLVNSGLIQKIVLMSQNLCLIHGHEDGNDEQGLAVGLLRTFPLEYRNIKALWLDTDQFPDVSQRQIINQKLNYSELKSTQRLAVTFGLRNNIFFHRDMAELPLSSDDLSVPKNMESEASITDVDSGFKSSDGCESNTIKSNATYLIIGGMGCLGLLVAKSLATRQCHIIIMGRTIDSTLQKNPEMHPDLAECIQQGARVTLIAMSAHDPDEMQNFVDAYQSKGEHISGVFNLAGRYVVQTIQDTSLKENDTNYIAKVKTTQVLHQFLAPLKPDFLVNFSSLASELSSYGYSDYTGSNFYQCLLAQKNSQKISDDALFFPVISIAWDNWKAGFGDHSDNEQQEGFFSDESQKMLSNRQGLSLLWRIIDSDYCHVIVSMNPLHYYQQQLTQSINKPEKSDIAGLDTCNRSSTLANENTVNTSEMTPIEKVCLSIFGQTLGINELLLSDDFLHKGGDSIMAVRLISRIRKIFQTEIGLTDFLSNRTVEAFSQYLAQNSENTTTAQAYLHLQSLSQKERQKLSISNL